MAKLHRLLLPIACASLGLTLSTSASAQYSTGFEDFTLGPLSSDINTAQGGWSGGAQGGLTNNDLGVDNGDGTFGDEGITNVDAHSGTQSWRYSRGYNSPGQGTAYTPNLSQSLTNDGDRFDTTIWFKPVVGGDNSLLAIETGNAAGDDRANILAYIDNVAGGLTIRSFSGANFDNVTLFTGVSNNEWHSLTFSMIKDGFTDHMTASLDGGTAISYDGSLNDWRLANSFTYSETTRLKFRPRHADGDISFHGFYLDDISYSLTPVPEPASMAALGLGVVALIRKRRSSKKA